MTSLLFKKKKIINIIKNYFTPHSEILYNRIDRCWSLKNYFHYLFN